MQQLKDFDEETIAARISLGEMVIDNYQGHVNQALVDKIAKNWDDSAAGAIILNLRDSGHYAVLDGQHRVLAAKMAGIFELSALVFIGKSLKEEARLFVQLNTKHTVRPADRFNANYVGGGITEKTIHKIVSDLGLRLEGVDKVWHTGREKNVVRSHVTLLRMYDSYGPAHLKTVLGVLQAAFGMYNDHRAYSDAGLQAVSRFLILYPQVSAAKLIEKLKKYSPTTITGMSVAKAGLGESAWVGYGRVMLGIMNAGVVSRSKNYLDTSIWDKKLFTEKGKAAGYAGRVKSLEKARANQKQNREASVDLRAAAKTVKR